MCEISDKICGNCYFVETKHGYDCICAIDNDFKEVKYFDEGEECFVDRSKMLNSERSINFD